MSQSSARDMPSEKVANDLFEHDVLVSVGDQYGKTAAQVALRWLIQREIVAIPKSVHEERIIQSFDVFDFELSTGDMDAISELNEGESLFFSHRNPEVVKQLGETKYDI